ncbi:hypothetical protein QF002_008322 [Paraburkholderia youngii]
MDGQTSVDLRLAGLNVSRSVSTSGICDAIEDDYPFMVFTNDTA